MFKFRFALQRSFGKPVPLNETQNLRDTAVESMTFTSLVGKETSIETAGSQLGVSTDIPQLTFLFPCVDNSCS